jgi:hypothetical protein
LLSQEALVAQGHLQFKPVVVVVVVVDLDLR